MISGQQLAHCVGFVWSLVLFFSPFHAQLVVVGLLHFRVTTTFSWRMEIKCLPSFRPPASFCVEDAKCQVQRSQCLFACLVHRCAIHAQNDWDENFFQFGACVTCCFPGFNPPLPVVQFRQFVSERVTFCGTRIA